MAPFHDFKALYDKTSHLNNARYQLSVKVSENPKICRVCILNAVLTSARRRAAVTLNAGHERVTGQLCTLTFELITSITD